jgi:hypothetical protein
LRIAEFADSKERARGVRFPRINQHFLPGFAMSTGAAGGYTVREIARRYRVGEDKVRAWIRRGELQAINTAASLCGKPRWVVMPEALTAFENRRRGGPAPKPPQRRRPPLKDYFPD